MKNSFNNKTILQLLIIVLLLSLFTGCSLYEKPTLISHTSDTSYTLTYYKDNNTNTSNGNTPAELLVSKQINLQKKDATTSYQFITLLSALQTFEDHYFSYLQETPSARDLVNSNVDSEVTDVVPSTLPYQSDKIHFVVESKSPTTNDVNQQASYTYIITMNLIDATATIERNGYTYSLSPTISYQLIDSGTFDYYLDTYSEDAKVPVVSLTKLNPLQKMDINTQGAFHYTIYDEHQRELDFTNQPLPKSILTQNNLTDLTASSLQVVFDSYIPSLASFTTYDVNGLELSSYPSLDISSDHLPISKDLLPESNGVYKGLITLTYDDESTINSHMDIVTFPSLTGNIEIEFFFKIFNEPIFTTVKDYYQPGDLIRINGSNITDPEAFTITSDTYHKDVFFGETGDDYIFLLPLTSRIDPGEYIIHFEHDSDPALNKDVSITIIDKEFEIQHLETSSSTASIRNEENYAQLNEAFARGRSNPHQELLWDSSFLQPVGGRISTEYGVIRYTNDNVESSRHGGIDFATPEGTLIVATHNGYVSLSEYINITGNTLFIDHGLGIYSQYYHMNELYVEEGQYVEKGEAIGEVGSTGFSTGPHLHFSIYYSGVYLNPWKFFDEAPF